MNTSKTLDTALVSATASANVESLFDVCSGVALAAGEAVQIVTPPRLPSSSKRHGRRQYGIYNPAHETSKNIQSMFDTLINFPFVGAK